MPQTKQEFRTNLLVAIILYAAVFIYQGYQYGQGDQSQILPCLWAQDHPGAYAHDHYVQHYLSSGINERTIFHFLIKYLGYDQPWLVWLWHAISGIGLITAWISIASIFIKTKVWQWLTIGMILILGFHTATGSNELYYNHFVPSLPAKALASWALFYWLRDKYLGWSILLILAGFLQPLVGLQLFLLTTIALVVEKWKNKKPHSLPWRYILTYGIATSPWLYLLAINNGSRTDPVAFINIIEFRLSHHFFASSFGWIHLLFGLFFAVISIWFYKGRLRWALIAVVAGCIVYELGVEVMRWPIALYTQWWKTTIWMEAFAFIAIIATVEKIEPLNKLVSRFNFFIPLTILVLVSIYRLSGLFGDKPVSMVPWGNSKSDKVDISELAQRLTSENAVFVIPPDLTAFRWYSKRDTYVDNKAMLHTETFLKDWYERIVDVYQFGFKEKKEGFTISETGLNVLTNPSPEIILKWRSLGISHIISPAFNIKGLEVIGQNEGYSIYRLP